MLARWRLSLYPLERSGRRFYHERSVLDHRWPGWNVVIGIEVHAQLKSSRKLFSDSLATDGASPNSQVSPFDGAFPGTLPTLNTKCVELATRTALALGSNVNRRSTFDRKHYFYSDNPAGFQITQHYAPFATDGRLHLAKQDTHVRIKQIQLEQDTGKSILDPQTGYSLIDLNRAGVGLMEIVSEPDMRSPAEACEYIRTLQALLRSVGSCDGNMEMGSLRCDVNVSVNRTGEPLGTRCEIKNLNSVKYAMIAIASEVFRQISVIESGQHVSQETRGFSEDKAETFSLRSKEDAPDYRYMPDPNLPPLLVSEDFVERVRETMPELPSATQERLAQLGLSSQDIGVILAVDANRELGYDGDTGLGGLLAYFDALSFGRSPRVVVSWVTNNLLGQLAVRGRSFSDNPISVEHMGSLIDLVQNGVITGTSGKKLLMHMLDNPSDATPHQLVQELGLARFEEDRSLATWCQEAIDASPEEVVAIRRGNLRVIDKLVGRVMKSSRGRADARSVRDVLAEMLKSPLS